MKAVFLMSLFLVLPMMFSFPAAFAADTAPEREALINVSGVSVLDPLVAGQAAVMVVGYFPNGCYYWKRYELHPQSNHVIEVRSIAGVRNGMCTMALVPFKHVIDLKSLKSGQYSLHFMKADGSYLEKTIDVQ